MSCAICLNEIINDKVDLKCGHFFDLECFIKIKKDELNNVKCPLCRKISKHEKFEYKYVHFSFDNDFNKLIITYRDNKIEYDLLFNDINLKNEHEYLIKSSLRRMMDLYIFKYRKNKSYKIIDDLNNLSLKNFFALNKNHDIEMNLENKILKIKVFKTNENLIDENKLIVKRKGDRLYIKYDNFKISYKMVCFWNDIFKKDFSNQMKNLILSKINNINEITKIYDLRFEDDDDIKLNIFLIMIKK